MQGLTLPLAATLLSASVWAVREDLMSRRIPNRLTGSLLCVGLALQLTFGGWGALREAGLGAVVGFAMLLPLYLLRATGAGDVKLLTAMGALLGPYWTFLAGAYTLIGGGVLALAYLMIGALRAAAAAPAGAPLLLRFHYGCERAQRMRRERFPYALAIAIGAIAAAWQRGDIPAVINYLSRSS